MAPSYLEGLGSWPLGDLRSRRDEATVVETGLSYLRRIVQGRLDILLAEQRRREAGEQESLTELVDQLPSILSEHVHAPGLGRLPALMGPGELDSGLEGRLEEAMPENRLANVTQVDSEELGAAINRLVELEREVSGLRRAVFDVLDRLQEEIVRRYRTGEATVDSLLP
jgi:anti-sigma-K factor RsiG